MNVISIQSQVAFGHVGNSAAVFPMQMHGIDVVAVPTTLLSNRPGYPTIRGRVLDPQLLADLLRGIEERGAVDAVQMILSGYLGSADNAAVVADFVARAKAKNPELLYCCDPVLGDSDRGLFVHADIPPLASAAPTRRMRSAMPPPPSSPCWSARLLGLLRKCASSRALSGSCIRRANSNVSRSASSPGWSEA